MSLHCMTVSSNVVWHMWPFTYIWTVVCSRLFSKPFTVCRSWICLQINLERVVMRRNAYSEMQRDFINEDHMLLIMFLMCEETIRYLPLCEELDDYQPYWNLSGFKAVVLNNFKYNICNYVIYICNICNNWIKNLS